MSLGEAWQSNLNLGIFIGFILCYSYKSMASLFLFVCFLFFQWEKMCMNITIPEGTDYIGN